MARLVGFVVACRGFCFLHHRFSLGFVRIALTVPELQRGRSLEDCLGNEGFNAFFASAHCLQGSHFAIYCLCWKINRSTKLDLFSSLPLTPHITGKIKVHSEATQLYFVRVYVIVMFICFFSCMVQSTL